MAAPRTRQARSPSATCAAASRPRSRPAISARTWRGPPDQGRPMTTSNFIDHDTWFARLPGVVVAAGALITDPAGRILLVKPNYRDHWTLPGGICEHGEPPHAGCAREIAEELGLDLEVSALLAID